MVPFPALHFQAPDKLRRELRDLGPI